MIEILKKGTKKHKYPTYIKKCWYCGCIYTYKDDDLSYTIEADRFLNCPQCGVSNNILFRRKYKGGKQWKNGK